MNDTVRWRPPLPSLGRLGGVPVSVERSSTVLDKLQHYYAERRSVSDIFECRISPARLWRAWMTRHEPRYLSEFNSSQQVHLLLNSLYFKASDNLKRRLRTTLQKKGGLGRVRNWWHSANAAVLPYLITQDGDDYETIDHLTRWCLENCANNYAEFQRDWKSLKKALRKGFATGKPVEVKRSMRPYAEVFFRKDGRKDFSSPEEWGRYVLCWTQTRATGLADHQMMVDSAEKFCRTVTTPGKEVTLNPEVLRDTVSGALGVRGEHSRISVGTTSCLESTRSEGGKSSYVSHLTRHKVLHTQYSFQDLTPEVIEPRRVQSSQDVVTWAVQECLHKPAFVRTVRLHVVAEPGKARTITIAPYSYQVLMGVFAHMFQATLIARGVKSGLTRDRHLWRFLQDSLNPQNVLWDSLGNGIVWGLSTDLSEATDYGNLMVSRQIWVALITLARARPGFPIGLATLAMNLYCGKRYIFVPTRQGYKLVTRLRGWFMGDMMTKVILTIVHDYTMRLDKIQVYSLVGDDEVALSNDSRALLRHLDTLQSVDLKVSVEDTFVSRRLIFYCEEGSVVPQRPSDSTHVRMRRRQELMYLDYPRIRLLLACTSETDTYSMTNVGRFALLGKEARWVHNVNPKATEYFARASILQHIIVPQDSDTLCPFTPLEMGGDGAFTPHPGFLRKVVDDKSRDPRETKFRALSLLQNKMQAKFVRSDRLNEVVHKHHLLLPVLEKVREYLPPDAVLTPRDDKTRLLLDSMRVQGLEFPEQTWLRLCRGFYYGQVFQGKKPVEPSFNLERSYTGGYTSDPVVDFDEFIHRWANPGFRFATPHNYYVWRDKVECIDPLHVDLGLRGDPRDLNYPSAFRQYQSWLDREVDLTTTSLPDIINFIVRGTTLPDRVVKRLNLFMESDNYVLSVLPRENVPSKIAIITRDYRLCSEVRHVLDGRGEGSHYVFAVDPALYLVGRMYEVPNMPLETYGLPSFPEDITVIEDPGAILHVDYTEFQDGFYAKHGIDQTELIFECEIDIRRHNYHPFVVVVRAAA